MKPKFNPWPYGVILFFVVLIGSLATVVVIAASHPETMVSNNYYEQELKYQARIDSTTRAEKCGARVQLDAASHKLLLAVPADQVSQKFTGTIELYRPSSSGLDREFAFAPGADGTQTIDLSSLTGGLWLARVQWSAAGQDYYLEQKLDLATR